ncbi:ankyrin repeat domain-containing protein [Rhodococcoides kyotonense]|uniref:Uncharacterized protein n=1 Tax=Rhodococcoides kyotonense TaxID=398843 RepID=A0A239ILF0_9NOCA|nr:ankyrin repeat domain-containing protein [Rhodococcus kyotonensis]SNS93224.1 hypothetical protein SAMN05421642_10770 [Rhodococcus kyotonensis]
MRRWTLLLLVALFCTSCAQLDRFLSGFRADADRYFDDSRVVELIHAAADGDADELRRMIADGADIESLSNDHDSKRAAITPLMWAVEFASPRAVTTLLEAGADPLAETSGKYNAVNYAVLRDNVGSIEALLDFDPELANAPDRFGGNSLHSIALYGRDDMLELFVDRGADLNTTQTVSGQTPLFSAANVNNVAMCLKLVRAGADAGIRNDQGRTFLTTLFDTNDKVMNREFLSGRDDLVDELRKRGFPVETGR